VIIAFTALANAANVAQDGNLNILGAFDSIIAHSFPHRHPTMVLAFRTRCEYEDQNRKHRLRITLQDSDSKELWGAEAEMEPGPITPGNFTHASQILTFQDIVFPRPGRYKFRFVADEGDPHDVVFQVLQVPEQQG
jgi:hypothetical protein